MSEVQQATIPKIISEGSREPEAPSRLTTEPVNRVFCWQKTESERKSHVIARAQERGGIAIDAATVGSIEQEIAYVRSLAIKGSQKPKALATKVAHDYLGRTDFYAVLLGDKRHIFVWCRESSRLVSYIHRPDLLARMDKTKRVRRLPSLMRLPERNVSA